MNISVLSKSYDGGVFAGARWVSRKQDVFPGMIAFVDTCTSKDGLFVLKTSNNVTSGDRPLGVVTDVTANETGDVLVQVQTDGTLTLTGLLADNPKKDLAPGNSIAWDEHGALDDKAPLAQRIGYILHSTPFSVRILITHDD